LDILNWKKERKKMSFELDLFGFVLYVLFVCDLDAFYGYFSNEII